jgi:hypothetical protein
MKALRLLVTAALLLAGAAPARAQSVSLEFKDGRVKLVTQNAPVSLILAEWARRGRTTIVNGERVPGPPATLELNDVTEQEALDIILRTASGYLMAARETPTAGASAYDRILILPTSRVTNTSSVPPPAAQAAQAVQSAIVDDDDGPPPPPGPGQRVPPNLPPGVRLPPQQQDPNRVPPQSEEPETRPAPTPGNPFGVVPGSSQPGVVSPIGSSQPGVINPPPPRRDSK